MKNLRILASAALTVVAFCLSEAIAIADPRPVKLAQVIEDTTLGVENSSVDLTTPNGTQDGTQNGAITYRITGGATRGANLFHSFEQFSVGANDTAIFANATAIENIIGRVTGLEASTLNGRLQAAGSANLFLINPAGIVIGPNASLDIGGSFLASTGDVQFEDGTIYSGLSPDRSPQLTSPLLTISAPIGLPVETAAGKITVMGQGTPTQAGIALDAGQTLSLVGGEIELTGARLSAAGGRIELRSGGDIQLSNQSVIDTSSTGGGAIALRGKTITLAGRSALISDTLGDIDGLDIQIVGDRVRLLDNSYLGAASSGSGNSGNISVTAAQDIEITGTTFVDYKQLELNVFLGIRQIADREIGGIVSNAIASGRTGDISLSTQRLLLDEGVLISTESFGTGDSGDIDITATESLQLDGSGILAGSRTTGIALLTPAGIPTGQSTVGIPAGSGGNIDITTSRLAVENGSNIVAGTTSDGAAGDLSIRATESVLLRGDFAPFFFPTAITTVSIGGLGPAGDLTIETGQLSAQDGSPIFADSGARAIASRVDVGGPAGNVAITATESVELIGGQLLFGVFISSGIRSRSFTDSPAGTVQITTPILTLQDGGQITSAARNSGNGGAINIDAQTVVISGVGTEDADARSGIVASAGVEAQTSFVTGEIIAVPARGAGGTINLNAEKLTIQDAAEISVGSFGTGGAGNLNLTAETIRLERGGSLSATTTSGEEGNITIAANQLTLDGSITTATSGGSNGGNLLFNLQDVLLLRDGSLISTDSGTAENAGNGGNITIEGGIILAVPNENSDIIANAVAGDGGRILLVAQDVIGFETSSGFTTEQLRNNQANDISASSEFGAPGEVQIFNQIENPVGASELPSELLGGERLIAQSVCAVGPGNNFVVTGRGGVPRSPQNSLDSGVVWTDEREDWARSLRSLAYDSSPVQLSDSNVISEHLEENSAQKETELPPVEAQGWIRLPDGRIALVSPSVSATATLAPPTCQMLSEQQSDE